MATEALAGAALFFACLSYNRDLSAGTFEQGAAILSGSLLVHRTANAAGRLWPLLIRWVDWAYVPFLEWLSWFRTSKKIAPAEREAPALAFLTSGRYSIEWISGYLESIRGSLLQIKRQLDPVGLDNLRLLQQIKDLDSRLAPYSISPMSTPAAALRVWITPASVQGLLYALSEVPVSVTSNSGLLSVLRNLNVLYPYDLGYRLALRASVVIDVEAAMAVQGLKLWMPLWYAARRWMSGGEHPKMVDLANHVRESLKPGGAFMDLEKRSRRLLIADRQDALPDPVLSARGADFVWRSKGGIRPGEAVPVYIDPHLLSLALAQLTSVAGYYSRHGNGTTSEPVEVELVRHRVRPRVSLRLRFYPRDAMPPPSEASLALARQIFEQAGGSVVLRQMRTGGYEIRATLPARDWAARFPNYFTRVQSAARWLADWVSAVSAGDAEGVHALFKKAA